MDGERRQSMRVSTRLPCEWQPLAAAPSRHELLHLFELPPTAAFAPELSRLSDAIQNAIHKVDNTDVGQVLELLNTKIDIVSHQQLTTKLPAIINVGLSLAGLDVKSNHAVTPGTWIGVHLVLEDGYHLVECGQVSRCTPKVHSFCIGVALTDMDPQNARRLARFVMRQPLS